MSFPAPICLVVGYDRPIAVRTIEITQPLKPIDNLYEYAGVRVYATDRNIPIGWFEVMHQFQPMSDVETITAEIAKLDWPQPTRMFGTNIVGKCHNCKSRSITTVNR